MESSGAVQLWNRSVGKRKIPYTKMIADGDSKSHTQINQAKPYGSFEIQKLHCVGHIQKRMGSGLRQLKKMFGKKRLADGKSLGG